MKKKRKDERATFNAQRSTANITGASAHPRRSVICGLRNVWRVAGRLWLVAAFGRFGRLTASDAGQKGMRIGQNRLENDQIRAKPIEIAINSGKTDRKMIEIRQNSAGWQQLTCLNITTYDFDKCLKRIARTTSRSGKRGRCARYAGLPLGGFSKEVEILYPKSIDALASGGVSFYIPGIAGARLSLRRCGEFRRPGQGSKMKFKGKVLVIGYGAVSRCALPLILKHVQADPAKVTVMDFADLGHLVKSITRRGVHFVRDRITQKNMGAQLAEYVGRGDLIIDLAWNIGCNDILQWCHDHDVLYVNTSVELWDPYEGAERLNPTDRTLYVRHMSMRKMMAGWKNRRGPTAVLDHGANPGLVSHFTKQALEEMATKWLEDHHRSGPRYEQISAALTDRAYNRMAHQLGVKVIHVSERDTQISKLPKRVNEFVGTWSIEGFYEEGIAPAEMGWGTHEKFLPPHAHIHRNGPRNQICMSDFGCRTWVRSWVPSGEIVGMVIRHGEAFSISECLTVYEDDLPIYRPTVHYAYCPCDAAIASLHELHMRNFKLQDDLRIMSDEITCGRDELGCLLMGHDYKSWWIGSMLDIDESRKLVPHQNATTLQVACSVVAAATWMIQNPRKGVCLPDQLPHEFILKQAKPYLGPMFSQAVDWSPLDNWRLEGPYGRSKPSYDDAWQFTTFLCRLG